jgi:hypothetical protein
MVIRLCGCTNCADAAHGGYVGFVSSKRTRWHKAAPVRARLWRAVCQQGCGGGGHGSRGTNTTRLPPAGVPSGRTSGDGLRAGRSPGTEHTRGEPARAARVRTHSQHRLALFRAPCKRDHESEAKAAQVAAFVSFIAFPLVLPKGVSRYCAVTHITVTRNMPGGEDRFVRITL